MFEHRVIAVVLALVVILGVTGGAAAQEASPAPSPSEKTTLVIGTDMDMTSANPFKTAQPSEWETYVLDYDFLFNFSRDTLVATSGLASYPADVSADGKTWTFNIRSDVTWSDGVPLTAHDIAFTYNTIFKNGLSSYMPYIGDPASFSAPNDTTFVWKMKTPSTAPLGPPDVPILPEHIWSEYASSRTKLKEFGNVPMVSSGPFHLTEWTEGQSWTMEANKSYWGGAPHVDQITFRVYNTPEALGLALKTGEVAAADSLSPTIFKNLQDDPNITTIVGAGSVWDDLAFNFEGTADPSLHDLNVRQAIEYSINKQALVDRVWMGYGSVGTSVIPPLFSQWAWQPSASETIGFDPEKAKSLLDQAGYKDIDGDGFRETPSGDPWSLEVVAITDYLESVPEAKLISGWMNDVGIKTSIKAVSQAKVTDLWFAQDFDMYVWGWPVEPDPGPVLSAFTTDQCGWWSDGCWSDSAYDELFKQQQAATDLAKRQALVTQMQQMLYEQAPSIPLVYVASLQAYRNDMFTGYVKSPQLNGYIFYGFNSDSERSIRPVAVSTSTSSSSSSSGIPVWIWIVVGLVVVVLGAVLVSRRKRAGGERE